MINELMATSPFVSFLTKHWPAVLVAGAFYVFMSVRIALQVKKIGRGPLRWFFITLFFTGIPAGVLFLWHNFGWLARGGARPDHTDDETGAQDQ